ncbi:TPA: HNH endonuclease [Salmonella enterica]|nr:HNH endonuclease [Salmonella enterica]
MSNLAHPLPPPDELRSMIYYENGEVYWFPEYRKGSRTDKPLGCIRNHGYKATRIRVNGVYRDYLLHRLIFWLVKGYWPLFIDHIDRNKLNNNIENLRDVTRSENSINKSQPNKTGFYGVHKCYNKYRLFINIDGKQQFLYGYETAEAAALARDILARLFHGEYATLNILDKKEISLGGVAI